MKTRKANQSECGITHHPGAMSASGPCEICGKQISLEPQYTPTPWKIDKETGVIVGAGKCFIASTDDKGIDSDNEANAEFIVRAVNSHEELVTQLTLAYAGLHHAADHMLSFRDCVNDGCLRKQAILAKAEGKE